MLFIIQNLNTEDIQVTSVNHSEVNKINKIKCKGTVHL